MRTYLIQITMPDGSMGRHHGLYPNGFAAVVVALELFPQARRISARRMS
jgi:hypothetical protein